MKRRLIAGFMTLAMVLGGFPVNAIASEETAAETVMETVETEETVRETVRTEETALEETAAPEEIAAPETEALPETEDEAAPEETEDRQPEKKPVKDKEEPVLLDADGDIEKPENPTVLTPDKDFTAKITNEGDVAWFSFTPSETETYAFMSDGNADTYAELYDGDMNLLDDDDDGGTDNNFKLAYEFEAGETYYFAAWFLNDSMTGSFTVKLVSDNGLKVFPKGEQGNTADIDVPFGDSVVLELDVKGKDLSGVTYQWFDWDSYEEIEGATDPSFEIPQVTEQQRYYCEVTDRYGNTAMAYFYVNIDTGFKAYIAGTDEETWLEESLEPGSSRTYTVVAESSDPEKITYQWACYDPSSGEDTTNIKGATSASYKVTNVTGPIEYYCYVEDGYGHDETISITISVDNKLQAYIKGSEQTWGGYRVPLGGSQRLEVEASAADMSQLTYQWEKINYDAEGNWISNEDIEDYNQTYLDVQNVQMRCAYRCEVTDQYGNNRSVTFDLYIDTGLKAYIKGTSRTWDQVVIAPDGEATLEVAATSSAAKLTYEWLYRDENWDFQTIPKATASTYKIKASQLPGRRIECRVRDGYGGVATVTFDIVIENHLKVTVKGSRKDWAKVYVPLGGQTTLEVEASADKGPLVYTWYDEYSDVIDKETTASLHVGPVNTAAHYRCEVTDPYGNEESVSFNVYVDNGFYAKVYGTYGRTDKSFKLKPGNTGVTLKIDAGTTDGSKVTYSWYKETDDGRGEYIKAGDTYETGPVNINTYYECGVTDEYGNFEEITFSVDVLNIKKASAKDNKTEIYVPLHKSATLETVVSAYDISKVTYQWYRNGERMAGETGASLKISDVTKAEEYDVYINDGFGNRREIYFDVYVDTGFEAYVSGTNKDSTTIKAAYNSSQTLKVDAKAAKGIALTYQWYKEGIESDEPMEGQTGNTLKLSGVKEPDRYYCKVTDSYEQDRYVYFNLAIENGFSAYASGTKETSKTLTVKAGASATLKVDLAATRKDRMTIWWSQEYYDEAYGYYDDDEVAGAATNTLVLNNIQRTARYYCYIDDGYGNYGSIRFNVTVDNTLTAVDQKTGKTDIEYTVKPGSNLDLTVKASAKTGKLSYSWEGCRYDSYGEAEYITLDEESNVLHVKDIQNYEWYECYVTDQYGNQRVVYYEIYIDNSFKAYVKGTTKTEQKIYTEAGKDVTMEITASAKTGGFTYEWIQHMFVDDARRYYEPRHLEDETEAAVTVKNVTEDATYSCTVEDKYHNPIYITFDIVIGEEPAELFTDVSDPSRYYYEPVYWAYKNGITVGAGGPGKFSPDGPCTREQIVTFLWRMMGEPEPAKHENFTDVPKGAWYDKPISWAYENGITTGLNDGTGKFGVGQSCTRAMCVTFFYRAAGKPSYSGNPKFTDVKDPKAYYYDAVRWAAVNNITVGLNDGTGRFGINVTCSRAMIVTFLYRYAHL